MKKTILNFFQKYRVCIKIDLLILIGFVVATICRNAVITGSNMVSFNLFDLYFIFGLPLCSLIYGFLSYIKTKRIWISQFILYVSSFLSWLVYWGVVLDMNALVIVALAGTFILSVYPVIFSLIGTFIAVLIKEGKEASEKIVQSSFAEPEEPIDVFTAKPSEILGKKKNASEEPEKTTPERDSSPDSETPPTQ